MKYILCLSLLLCFLAILVPRSSNARQANASDTIPQEVERIKVDELNDRTEELLKEYRRIYGLIRDNEDIKSIDSLYKEALIAYDTLKRELELSLNAQSSRILDNKATEWSSYKKLIGNWKNTIDERVKLLTSELPFVENTLTLWENSRDELVTNETSEEFRKNIDEVIDSVKLMDSDLKKEIGIVYTLQTNVSNLIQKINDDLSKINSAKLSLRSSFLTKDSPVLWKASDTTFTVGTIGEEFVKSSKENWNLVRLSLRANTNRSVAMLLILIAGLLILYACYRFRSYLDGYDDRYAEQARTIFNKFYLSALVISFTTILISFADMPMLLTESLVLILLIPVAILLPILVPAYIKRITYFIIILFILDRLDLFLPVQSLIYRLVTVTEVIFLVYIFYRLFRLPGKIEESPGRILKWTARLSPWIVVFLIASLVLNIAGYSRFSNYLVSSISSMLLAGFVILLVLAIFRSIIMLIFEIRKNKGAEEASLVNLRKRYFRVIEVLALLIWIRSALRSLNWYDPLVSWFDSLMNTTFEVGEGEISVGGIISFLFILAITYFLARGVKQFFTSRVIEKVKLPKGLPGAISMVIRYVIVAFGIYIALLAAGVDLGRFGLIAGALGVGIGFGLQNVVYNFISGIIIAFERPINVGDTVEVGTLMGTVTEVGVRSSKVKTFDGSEVIVPNGNLISKEVINWTLSDQKRRLKIPVKTSMNADPRHVLKIMREEAEKHPNTLKNPEPMTLFNGYVDTSLDFTLYFWVYFNASLSTRSDVALGIYDALKENGIEPYIPVQKWHMEGEK